MAHEVFASHDPAMLPTMRGVYNAETGTWSGIWAMSEAEFVGGTTGEFAYKRNKKPVPALAHGAPADPSIPPDMYMTGYFTYQDFPDKPRTKIQESNVLMRFDATAQSTTATMGRTCEVYGHGSNRNGPFHTHGVFYLESGELHVKRAYTKELPLARSNISTVAAEAASMGDLPQVSSALEERPKRSRVGLSAEQQKLKDFVAVVEKLQREDISQLFLQPVDLQTWTDYASIVKQPMDFGTIYSRLVQQPQHYTNLSQVVEDILLVFRNAQTYNPAGSPVANEAKRLHNVFKREQERLHKLWLKDDVMVIAASQQERAHAASSDDDFMSDSQQRGTSAPATSSASKRKSRPSAKAQKPLVTPQPAVLPPASLSAKDDRAKDEEIRRLKSEIEKLKESKAAAAVIAAMPQPPQPVKRVRETPVAVLPRPAPVRPLASSRDHLALSYQEQRVLVQQIHRLAPGKREGLVQLLDKIVKRDETGWVEFNLAQQPIPVQRSVCKYVREALQF